MLDAPIATKAWPANAERELNMVLSKRPKVLYIMGSGRSGTTVLTRILGQISGYFAAGEIRQIWFQNMSAGEKCSCGEPLTTCGVWRKVFDHAFGGIQQLRADQIRALTESPSTSRHIPDLFLPWRRARFAKQVQPSLALVQQLYHGIAEATSARVIVDSSKLPVYSYLLSLIPSIDLSIVHLVRDPRAIACSWQHAKGHLEARPSWYAAGQWNLWNMTGELLWRSGKVPYLRLRYEDFVQEPGEVLQRILDFVEVDADSLPVVRENLIELGQDHLAFGNPDRFQTGSIEVRLDDRWRDELKPLPRVLVQSICLPLMKHYGYN